MGTARDGVVISLRSCDRSFQRTAPPDSAEPPFASDFSDRHPAALLNPPIPLVHLKFTKEFSRLRKILHFSTVARGSQRKMATAAGNTTTAQPMYRPMDRQRNEIRLLRILPCSPSSSGSSLDFSSDVVQCEMKHYSLDDIIAMSRKPNPVPEMTSAEDGDEAPAANIARLSLKEHQPVSLTADIPAAELTMPRERVALLARRFMLQKDRFKKLFPRYDWDSDGEAEIFDYWMTSWIWTPLASENGSMAGYIALSYVWAPTCADLMAKELPTLAAQVEAKVEDRTEIILDGQRISIGNNLESALRALREIPEVQVGMPVWADALCINQSDIDERNFEVKRMDSIYSHATRVITWLSEADNRHAEALEFMNVVGQYLGRLERIDKNVASAWFATFDLHKMVEYQALLSDLPYWHRTWIVQEAALAPRWSNIICQNRRFLWTNILHFVYSFNKRRSESQSNFHVMRHYDLSDPVLGRKFLSFNSQVYCLHDAFGVRNTRDTEPLEKSMDAWFGSLYLRLASQANCKDSRDRVYGFMSIYPGDVAKFIQPDYAPNKTLAQVMGDLAIAHIKATSTLDWILVATDLSPSVDPWPSWVPNLSIPFKDVTITWVAGHHPEGKRKVAEVSWGSKDSCGVPALCVKGFKLDVISGRGSNYTREMDFLHPLLQSADNLDMLLGSLQAQMGALVEFLLPNTELESFAWIQQYIVSYFIENFKGRQSPRGNIKNGSKHRYKNEAGLREAIETCTKIIGWEPNPERKDITNIFAVPRHTVVEAPSQGQETTLGILGEDFTDFRRRNEHLDLWGRSLESFFNENRLQNTPSGIGSLLKLLKNVHRSRKNDSKRLKNTPSGIGSMLKLLKDMHRSRRANLFTTTGGYLGANLCRIQPGDEIYLLFGCRMPAVLRKQEGVHRLIGFVYVCGAMDGEAMDELEANGSLIEEVVIV
jgi:hypothetical protein